MSCLTVHSARVPGPVPLLWTKGGGPPLTPPPPSPILLRPAAHAGGDALTPWPFCSSAAPPSSVPRGPWPETRPRPLRRDGGAPGPERAAGGRLPDLRLRAGAQQLRRADGPELGAGAGPGAEPGVPGVRAGAAGRRAGGRGEGRPPEPRGGEGLLAPAQEARRAAGAEGPGPGPGPGPGSRAGAGTKSARRAGQERGCCAGGGDRSAGRARSAGGADGAAGPPHGSPRRQRACHSGCRCAGSSGPAAPRPDAPPHVPDAEGCCA